jgi:hypothetical protein
MNDKKKNRSARMNEPPQCFCIYSPLIKMGSDSIDICLESEQANDVAFSFSPRKRRGETKFKK